MSTPEENVEAVLRELDALDDIDVSEHPARYTAVHDGLRRLLNDEPRQSE